MFVHVELSSPRLSHVLVFLSVWKKNGDPIRIRTEAKRLKTSCANHYTMGPDGNKENKTQNLTKHETIPERFHNPCTPQN